MEIDVSKMRHHEAGTILLAHLALPQGNDDARGGWHPEGQLLKKSTSFGTT